MDSNLVHLIKKSSAIKMQMLGSTRLESLKSLLEFVNSILINKASIHVYADKTCLAAADHLYEELVVRYKSGSAYKRQDRQAICSYNYSAYSAEKLSDIFKSNRIDVQKDLLVLFMAEDSSDNQHILESAKSQGINTFIVASDIISDIAILANWQFLIPSAEAAIIYHFQSLALHVLCERLEPEFDPRIHGFEPVLLDGIKLDETLCADSNLLNQYSALRSHISSVQKATIFFAGNGGSACDIGSLLSQLNISDSNLLFSLHSTGALLAAYNDGYQPFARQLQACAKSGDMLIVYSTSGNSDNLIKAVEEAKSKSVTCIGLLGKDGGKLKNICDYSLIVASNDTARIQEMHGLISAAIFINNVG